MDNQQATVAVYNDHDSVNEAVTKLHKAGYNMKRISVIGRDYNSVETIAGYYNTGDQMKLWGGLSAFWDGLWDGLIGSGLFIIPGFGPLLFAGPFVISFVAALEGKRGVGELDTLGVALAELGIPNDRILNYQTEIKRGNFVLITHGTAEEVAGAKKMLANQPETILAGKAKSYAL